MVDFGVVGVGRMGSAMAVRLAELGHTVTVWDIDADVRSAQAERGLTVADGPAEVVEASDVVLTIVSEDEGVRRLYTGPGGYLSVDVTGKLFVEMSTLRPETHRALAPLVRARHAGYVDAPVLGTIPSAVDGTLVALVGGDDTDVDRARDALDPLTRRLLHVGPVGAGAALKLAMNLGMANYLQSMAETFALARSEGIEWDRIVDALGETPIATPFLTAKLPAMRGDSDAVTIDVCTLRKDVNSAVATGTANGFPMPTTAGTLTALSAAVAGGWGRNDGSSICRFFHDHMRQDLGADG